MTGPFRCTPQRVATWIIGTDGMVRRACQVTARQLTTAEQSTYFR